MLSIWIMGGSGLAKNILWSKIGSQLKTFGRRDTALKAVANPRWFIGECVDTLPPSGAECTCCEHTAIEGRGEKEKKR